MTETLDFEFHMNGFSPEAVIEAIEIHHCSLDAVNTETEEKVAPATISDSRYSISGTTFQASLKPASWNMFRIKVD
jgi:alpha-L-arabinofuranosidase